MPVLNLSLWPMMLSHHCFPCPICIMVILYRLYFDVDMDMSHCLIADQSSHILYIYTYILSARVVTHWNVRAEPKLLECAAEGGRLAKGHPMYGLLCTGIARTMHGLGAALGHSA